MRASIRGLSGLAISNRELGLRRPKRLHPDFAGSGDYDGGVMAEVDRRLFLLASTGMLSSSFVPAQEAAPQVEPEAKVQTRFAVNLDMWWRELPFLDRIRAAADFGFPAFEFDSWREKDLDGVKKLVEELGIEVSQFTAWGFSPGLNDPENHYLFEQEVRASCDAADKLGARLLNVVGGNDREGATKEEMHQAIIEGLARVSGLVAERGKTLLLEPQNTRVDYPDHCLAGSSDALAICRAVASPNVKLNWDLYHMQISEGDLCGHLREGFDQIGYIQVGDYPGRHEPGTGEIRYARVLREARDLGYQGFVGLECSPKENESVAAKRLAGIEGD